MPHRGEQELLLSRFDGTNLLVDSAYLGPTYLRRAQNWIPGETYRLEKRPGSTLHPAGALPGSVTRVHAMFATAYSGSRYLYVVCRSSGVDILAVSVNDGVWTGMTNADFATTAEEYGFEQMHDVVYASNGIDVPKKILLSAPLVAVNLVPVASFTDGSAAPTIAADVGAGIISGTYAYSWCIFDHTNGVWLERSLTREVTKIAAGDESISFPIPTGFATNGAALSSRYKAHLFVSPVNFPVELGHDQTPGGITTGAYVMRQVVVDGQAVPLRSVVRRGSALRAYRGRLVFAGDTTNPQAVWATGVIAPGNEQLLFNTGDFFPHNARLPRPPTDVTGIGLAAVGERGRDVAGPLVVTTISRTYVLVGDFLDDPSASFPQISARAGCIGFKAMTETPFGLFYVGTETVWCVPAGGGIPVDVGWPIRPAIKDIPPGVRARVIATYHKGFLKLDIVPAGASTATQGWWLDLRQGIQSIPSWWGPHAQVAPSCKAISQIEPNEPDRGWHAVEGTNRVELIHQPNRWSENNGATTIVSRLETGELQAGRAFDRKLWKRLRVMGKTEQETSLTVSTTIDAGRPVPSDPLRFSPGATQVWDATWDATWGGASQFLEAETIFEPDRPRGRTILLALTHNEAKAIALRELEIRYETVQRPTRSTTMQDS